MSSDKPNRPRSGSAAQPNRTLSLKTAGVNVGATSGSMMRGRGKSIEVEVKRSRTPTRSDGQAKIQGGAQALQSRLNRNAGLGSVAKAQSRAAVSSAQTTSDAVDDAVLEQQRQKAVRAKQALVELRQQQEKEQSTLRELENARREREQLDKKTEEQLAALDLERQQKAQRVAGEKAETQKVVAKQPPRASTSKAYTMSKLELAQQRMRQNESQQRESAALNSGTSDTTRTESSEPAVSLSREETPKPDKKAKSGRSEGDRRRQGKLTIAQALSADGETFNRSRSVAAIKRQRDKEKARALAQRDRNELVVREVVVPETIQVGDLAGRMAVRGADVIKHLFRNSMIMKLNDYLDADTAQLVVEEFGHKAVRVAESDVEDNLEIPEDTDAECLPRSPVVTVMGHVDHGKTTLLDTLRKARVAAGEAGGITQHIAAYRVPVNDDQTVTFLDTPGHEAFSSMRSRGAKATDIVVLVVAANDGVLPQTIEAINHAKAAKVPIIVAINKCDLPAADPQNVRLELLSHEVVGEENGGDTLMVEISALNGTGIEQLLEVILLQAELLELKTVHTGRARGVVIEARQEVGRGVVATILVQSGCLRKGDIFVAGHEWGRVKMQYNDQGKVLKEAGPSCPVEIQGLQGVVLAGDDMTVVVEESQAREIAEYRQRKMNETRLALVNRNSIDQMFKNISNKEVSELNIILRTDVLGSSEAITQALHKIGTDEVSVRVIHSGIGAITETDVTLAQSSNALIVGFNVRANAQARDLARREGIALRYFAIIYELIDDVKALASGLLAPEEREEFLGYAEIRQVFNLSKIGVVAGCIVTEGTVRRGAEVRLLRDDVVVHRGQLSQLKRHKDDVTEVRSGTECGMSFENHNDLKVGDIIECFNVVQEQRQL